MPWCVGQGQLILKVINKYIATWTMLLFETNYTDKYMVKTQPILVLTRIKRDTVYTAV